MKQLIAYVSGAALVACGAASYADTVHGEDKPEPPSASSSSPHVFSANVGITTDYVFRGLTQSNEGPSIAGGFDYEYEPLGFYLGFWAGSIEFNLGSSNSATVETNFYSGFAGEFGGTGIGWDLGALYYFYPDQNEDCCGAGDYDYVELYGDLSYTWEGSLEPSLSAGFDWSPDYFGEDDTGWNVDSELSFSLPYDISFYGTVSYLDVKGDKTFSRSAGAAKNGYDYIYWSVGGSKELGILEFDLHYVEGDSDCKKVLAGGDDDLCQAVVFSVSSSW